MASSVVMFLLSVVLVAGLLAHWLIEVRRHRRRLDRLALRIHVNGIRGKSTVTRILAGLLRESGRRAFAKCTGSAAAVIFPDGSEAPIQRRAAATILEQIEVLGKQMPSDTEAVVIECMALKPEYQAISESQIIRSNIGVITNVREDHQDVMGETLSEIAQSLLNTCPEHGILITAEQDRRILSVMRREAHRRGTTLIVVDPDCVTDADIAGFDYVAFKDNVAIGLALAQMLGIARSVAMRGMQRAAPDPGALKLKHLRIGDKHVSWANLFAVNDRQSTITAMNLLERYHTKQTLLVGLLNNRSDREQRAFQFADIATQDLCFDRLVTLGAYEKVVVDRLTANGFPRGHIITLGQQKDPGLDEMLEAIVRRSPLPHVLLVGLVNIHTKQAELLLECFEGSEPESETVRVTADRSRRVVDAA